MTANRTRSPFTARGWSVLVIGLLLMGLAWLMNQRDACWLATALCALPPLAYLWTLLPTRRLTLARHSQPRRASVNEAVLVVLQLTTKRFGLPMLAYFEERLPAALGVNPMFALSVPARGDWQRSLSYELTPDLRGRYEIGPLRAQLGDPLGMSRRTKTINSVNQLVVYPRLIELPGIRTAAPGQQVDESLLKSGALGQDDILLRDYRMGDDVRRVHWRSTAKFGDLMVRREEQSDQPRARIILDDRTSHHRGAGATSTLELAVSATASIALALRASGQRVIVDDASGELYDSERHQMNHFDVAGDPLLEALVDVELIQSEQLLTAAVGRLPLERIVLVLGGLSPADLTEIAAIATAGLAILTCPADDSAGESSPADQLRQLGWRVIEISDRNDLSEQAHRYLASAGRAR